MNEMPLFARVDVFNYTISLSLHPKCHQWIVEGKNGPCNGKSDFFCCEPSSMVEMSIFQYKRVFFCVDVKTHGIFHNFDSIVFAQFGECIFWLLHLELKLLMLLYCQFFLAPSLLVSLSFMRLLLLLSLFVSLILDFSLTHSYRYMLYTCHSMAEFLFQPPSTIITE